LTNKVELGLCLHEVHVGLQFKHKELSCDDFGPTIPAEVMYNLASATIALRLCHWDISVVNRCWSEACGGNAFPGDVLGMNGVLQNAGTLPPNGLTLGRGRQPMASGNHYVSLNILSPQLQYPFRFPFTYITGDPPSVWPMGTEKSILDVTFRAIPYVPPLTPGGTPQELSSSGAVLWGYIEDM
jgi:hypothetical protein